ncbi:hypothetical protein Pst134EA_025569 [Puccinia striiformis f. sp. tritici]|uniref:hypothetical protein n=1 Tax=Puccinia striiformis f. sp. tritici TaxID=168172 RepID=UPI002007D475|nr:hypothetical protein Pst134EA_025569 [Puccinia striiformis f. sp. tritici]KAH9451621.1 hypothetical protein Pst134EA_025569 [Puccinia striiformis f. sp. tritici]
MNIKEWEKALEAAEILTEYQDVIDGFKNAALLAKEKIESSIAKEVQAKQMFGPFTTGQLQQRFKFFRTNPLSAVVNGNGSVRPVNDLSYPRNIPGKPSVNSFVDKLDYKTTWDDFETVSRFFRQQTEPLLLAIFDWEKAYRQIPTAKSQWPYLMLRDFGDGIMMDTRIAFGGVAGCGSFGRPADAWKILMKHKFNLVRVFWWVDDNLFVQTTDSTVTMDQIVIEGAPIQRRTEVHPIHLKRDEENRQTAGQQEVPTNSTSEAPPDTWSQQIF